MSASLEEQIAEHLTAHLGAPLPDALHEIVGPLKILVVPPNPRQGRFFQTLVTAGMSHTAMPAPRGQEAYRHVELFLHLPPDWPLGIKDWTNPDHYWPIEWMRLIAHYPESAPVFLGPDQTMGSGEPFAPGTGLSSMMMLHAPGDLGTLSLVDGRTVSFYQLIPIYEEERLFKKEHGTVALLQRFEDCDISQVIDPERPNVALEEREDEDGEIEDEE